MDLMFFFFVPAGFKSQHVMESEVLRAKADHFLTSRYRSEIDALEAAKSDKIPLYLGYPPRKMVARVAEMMKDACQKRLVGYLFFIWL